MEYGFMFYWRVSVSTHKGISLSDVVPCYSGLQSIFKCYPEYFDETLCTSPTFIEVQSADYGKTTNPNCAADDKDCWQDVKDVDLIYYQSILTACNGNTACVSLIATRAYMSNCSNALSNYVEIFYRCVTGKFETNCFC